ncbi:hypothetical protein GW17_00047042 [Ensete ventricosum]|nr:hypothetical protein GW17_00047042 [Ensete ventricosum]RZS05835.1 hypothetical protein BHM03_00036387 [Ensete ventricosum]
MLPLPQHRRRLPLPTSSSLPRGGHPCGWPRAAAPCELPAPDPLCERRATSGCARERLSPLRAGRSRPSRERLSPLLAGDVGHGLAVGGRPCMGAGRGWPPLLLTAFAAKM